jgi:hypothetical protein
MISQTLGNKENILLSRVLVSLRQKWLIININPKESLADLQAFS